MEIGKTLTPTPHLPLFLQNSHIFPFLKLGASWLYQVWSQEGFAFKTGLKIRPKMRLDNTENYAIGQLCQL